MQIIDIFSGIGVFSFVGKMLGWRTVQFIEIDPFCRHVLRHYHPGVPIHDDIKTFQVEQLKQNKSYEPSDATIVVGGFP